MIILSQLVRLPVGQTEVFLDPNDAEATTKGTFLMHCFGGDQGFVPPERPSDHSRLKLQTFQKIARYLAVVIQLCPDLLVHIRHEFEDATAAWE